MGGVAAAATTAERPSAPSVSATTLWAARACVAGAALFAAVALWTRRGYVPIWDGRVYADCIVRAARAPNAWAALTDGALRCAEHPSHAYVAIQALTQRLDPGSYPLMLATNVALLAVAGWAFRRVLRGVLSADVLAPERALLLAAFLVQPLVLATVVQVNLDFPVLVCMAGGLAAVVDRRRAELAAWGLLASFTKETGALLYAALAVVYVLVHEVPGPIPRAVRMALALGVAILVGVVSAFPDATHVVPVAVLAAAVTVFAALPRPLPVSYDAVVHIIRRGAPLAVPPLALGAYLAWRASTPGTTVVWGEGARLIPIPVMLLGLNGGPAVTTWLGVLLVMSFAWIATLPVALDAAIGLVRFSRRLPRRPTSGVAPNAATATMSFFAASALLLTRVQTAPLPRYMVPAVPVLLAAAGVALVRLRVGSALRRAVLAALAVSTAASVAGPIDPVSRVLWGTFRAGRREHLRVRCSNARCNDHGLDVSVVDPQFASFSSLVQAGLDRTRGDAQSRYPLAMSVEGDWHVVDVLDAAGRRSLNAVGGHTPAVLHIEKLAIGAAAPDTVWYLAVPWVRDAGMLAAVSRRYRVARADTVWADGNAMSVLLLVRTHSAAAR